MSTAPQQLELFTKYFAEFTDVLVAELKDYEMPDFASKYVERMIKFNVWGGKLNRGLAVMDTVEILQNKKPSEDDLKMAAVVGWGIEWLQAFFLIADDIMDASVMRRQQPCWYRVKDVQMQACNDYIILENQIYRLLKKYVKSKPYYVDMLELFLETSFQTELGQLLDLRSVPPDAQLDISTFSLDIYKRIVKYKTAFYSFYLPIAAGLLIVGIKDEKIYSETKDICIEMGEYFQIQDDFLDCYADPKVLGKVGRDIEEKKCCWMICSALERASEDQIKVLKENYGFDDAEKVKNVKEIYNQLDMKKVYSEYEEKAIKSLKEKIKKISIDQEIFLSLLSKIEKRTK